jgi:hypothetical protein
LKLLDGARHVSLSSKEVNATLEVRIEELSRK